MRLFRSVLAAVTATLLLECQALGTLADIADSNESQSYGFIIELSPGSSFSKRRDDVHSEFHKRAREIVADYEVRVEFKNPDIFYGVSVDAKNEKDIQALLKLAEVKGIWPNRYHQRPIPFGLGNATVSATSFETRKREAVEVVHITGTSDVNSALKMTGVDALHELGFKGEGMKVGILDTGVDYRHPALGAGFGKGFKIAGGYDLVGDDYFGGNIPVPDDDPLVTCLTAGHGTHVAGIVGAEDPEGVGYGIIGVAPQASIYMYRIFGCVGGVTDEIILRAFETAADDGVDVITMSVGATRGWETGTPLASVFASIKALGIAMFVSAGNGGSAGPYYASWPALDSSIVSVGSVSNTNFATMYTAKGSDGASIGYAHIAPIDGPDDFHVFFADEDDAPHSCRLDYWDEIAKEWPDVDRVIAVMRGGGMCLSGIFLLQWRYKISNIWIVVDDAADIILSPPGDLDWIEGRLRPAEAAKIAAGIVTQGKNFTLNFQDRSIHDEIQPSAGRVSIFSSMGPTVEMSLSTQLSGPGGNILSTWVASDGLGYAIISGTSMSTPHVAACYALIKQALPGLSVDDIISRMQTTSTPLEQRGYNALLTSPIQQGSGLVNALKAIRAETTFTQTELNLRETATSVKQEIAIENISSEPKTYTITHKGASYINTAPDIYTETGVAKFYWSQNNSPNYAVATFSTDQLTLQAGDKGVFTVTIAPPTAGVDVSMLPLYGGFIAISDDTQEYVIPYTGVPYKRGLVPVLDFGDLHNFTTEPLPPNGVPNQPMIVALKPDRRNNDMRVFTFPAEPDPTGEDDPKDDDASIGFTLRQPSPYVRIDVVHPHQKVHPDDYGFDLCHRFETIDPAQEPVDNFLGMPSYGMVYNLYGGFDKPYYRLRTLINGYGYYVYNWPWALVSTPDDFLFQLPNADYRVLIRALKYGYDWQDPNGYESWLGPIVRVNITVVGREFPYGN